MFELVLRLVFSLAVVIGLLLLLAKFSSRRFRGRSGALVQILHRQPLSRSSAVAVVTVGTRVLVLGTTEQQVTVLAELDPDEIELPEPESEAESETGSADDEPPGEPRRAAVEELRPRALAALSRGRAVRSATTPTARRSGRHAAPTASPATADGPLAGSVLSPDTWRQALAAATRVIS